MREKAEAMASMAATAPPLGPRQDCYSVSDVRLLSKGIQLVEQALALR